MKKSKSFGLVVLFLLFAATAAVAEETVHLAIDFNQDGVKNKQYAELPWADGMTVLDALHAAGKEKGGPKIAYRGRGATAFLQKIDSTANEGGGDKNWIYRVNGKLGDRSFAVKELSAGDKVLWRFQEYE